MCIRDRASMPLNGLSFFVDSYQRAVANSKDYLEAMHEPTEPDDMPVSYTHLDVYKRQLLLRRGSRACGATPAIRQCATK